MTSSLQKLISLSAVLLLCAGRLPLRAAEPSAIGLWEQVGATSGKPESWFRISEKNGIYEGVLVKVFFKPGDDPNCDKCEGEEKGRLLGLALIKGMQRNGLKYENGRVLDPRDGATYRAMMMLSPDGQKLEVRAIVGVPEPWNGRTIWNRLRDDAVAAPASPGPTPGPAP